VLVEAIADRFQTVVLSAKTSDHSHIARQWGARLLRVPVGEGNLHARADAFDRAVRRQLESEEYDLTYVTDSFGGYAVAELKARYGYRVVYDAFSLPSWDLPAIEPKLAADRRLWARLRRQEPYALLNADAVLTGAPSVAGHLQQLGVPEERLRVMRAPVPLSTLPRAKLGVPDATPMRVLYLGSSAPHQGLHTAITALAYARAEADVELTLAGPFSTSERARLSALAAELQVKEALTLSPPVPHDGLLPLLSRCDLGLVCVEDADRARQLGGALAKASEYLAAGRPIVASDFPFTRALLPAEVTSFFTPKDAASLARRLVQAAKDPAGRVRKGQKARDFAERHLDTEVALGPALDLLDGWSGHRRTSADDDGEQDSQTERVVLPGQEGKTEPTIPAPRPPPRRGRTHSRPVELPTPSPSRRRR
jgi:glycosyltransferase involved in cell wall biosynthesis